MKEKKVFKGFWFLPQNPEVKVPGILKFNPTKGLKLDLIGSFEIPKNLLFGSDTSHYYEIICGKDSQGNELTLIDCFRSNYSFTGKSDFALVSYNVKNLIEEISLRVKSQELFSCVSFGLNVMPQFMGKNILKESLFFDNEGIEGFQFKYKKSDQEESYCFQLDDYLSLDIVPNVGFKDKFNSGIEIHENFLIKIRSTKARNLSFFNKVSKRFISFIKLSFNSPVFFTNYYLEKVSQGEVKLKYPWVKVWFFQEEYQALLGKASGMKFYFDLIKPSLEVIFKKWFGFDEKMNPILDNLIEVNKNNKLFSSSDFLMIVQSLDGFHRRFIANKQMSFESRLNHLVKNSKDVSNIRFTKDELKKISENRHYYTHIHNDEDLKFLYDQQELYIKTRGLSNLLFCSIMKEAGFTLEIINKCGEDPYLI